MRSRPARSWWTVTSVKPAARASGATASPWVSPISTTTTPCGREPVRGLSHDVLDRFEAGRSRVERTRGLPLRDIRRKHLVVRDVRRVRDDEVERAPNIGRERGEPLPLHDAHGRAPAAQPGEVRPRDRKRIFRHVGRPDLGAAQRQLVRERQRDRAGTGAEVGDAQHAARVDQRARGDERALHHLLGLGPRDEHPAVDPQVELAKRPRPEHVLQRLAGGTPRHHQLEVRGRHLRRRGVEVAARRLLGDPLRLPSRQQPRRRRDDQVEPRRLLSQRCLPAASCARPPPARR